MGPSRSCGSAVNWIDTHGGLLSGRLLNTSSGLNLGDRKMGNRGPAAWQNPLARSRSRCNKLRHLASRFLLGQDHLARPGIPCQKGPALPCSRHQPDPGATARIHISGSQLSANFRARGIIVLEVLECLAYYGFKRCTLILSQFAELIAPAHLGKRTVILSYQQNEIFGKRVGHSTLSMTRRIAASWRLCHRLPSPNRVSWTFQRKSFFKQQILYLFLHRARKALRVLSQLCGNEKLELELIDRRWKPFLTVQIDPIEQHLFRFRDEIFVVAGRLLFVAPIEARGDLTVRCGGTRKTRYCTGGRGDSRGTFLVPRSNRIARTRQTLNVLIAQHAATAPDQLPDSCDGYGHVLPAQCGRCESPYLFGAVTTGTVSW